MVYVAYGVEGVVTLHVLVQMGVVLGHVAAS